MRANVFRHKDRVDLYQRIHGQTGNVGMSASMPMPPVPEHLGA